MMATATPRLRKVFGLGLLLLLALPTVGSANDIDPMIGGSGRSSSSYATPSPVDFAGEPAAVLFYQGNDPRGEPDEIIEITNFYRLLGATAVEVSAAFPEDFSAYRLVFLMRPEAPFSQAQVEALADFVAGTDGTPGRLVVVGEHRNFYDPRAVQVLLDLLGVDIQFDNVAVDQTCENATDDFGADRLMKGIPLESVIRYAYTDTLTLGPDAKKVLGTKRGAPMVAVSPAEREILGDVVVMGDSSLLVDGCDPGSNLNRLWRNLIVF